MNRRFRITRTEQADAQVQEISLTECQDYFTAQPDFTYEPSMTVRGPESVMTIEGDFFMWQHEEKMIPFRHYMGDLYVAIVHEDVVARMVQIASDLRADIVEG